MTDRTKHDGKRKATRHWSFYSFSKNKLRKRANRALSKATRRARKRQGLREIAEQQQAEVDDETGR